MEEQRYEVVLISPILRKEYVDSLIFSQRKENPESETFIKLISECIIETERDYCRMLDIKV